MKKYFWIFLFLALLPSNVYGQSIKAIPAESNVKLDGSYVYLKGYSVEGSNYYRLRDIAYIFKETDKYFNVMYDGKNNLTQIFKNRFYFGLTPIFDSNENPIDINITKNNVIIDGRKISTSGFNYNGYYYYRLRDLAYLLNFAVEYNSLKNETYISTDRSFIAAGSDYVKAPVIKDPKNLDEFNRELKKLYFAFDSEQKEIKNMLYHNGITFSKLMSFNKTIQSFYLEFTKLRDCNLMNQTANANKKELMVEFLNKFEQIKISFEKLTNSVLYTGLIEEQSDVDEYLLKYEDMQYIFMELINQSEN